MSSIQPATGRRLRIAIIGTGISGMSAAWLLSPRHDVTIYERDARLGGHSNTVDVASPDGPIPVDTGFIVYNERTYPNLTALFQHLEVPTQASEMSFAVSLDDGNLEYSGGGLGGLFAQKRNVVRPRFWSMLNDLHRFYRDAPTHIAQLDDLRTTLSDYLDSHNYGDAFRNDHLLPMAGAIWSAAPSALLKYPAGAFIRFHDNHGLLQVRDRPVWRTVARGSRTYIERLMRSSADRVRLNAAVSGVRRIGEEIVIREASGRMDIFDHVILACHADQALAMLADPSPQEKTLLGAFRYSRNVAVLHTDATLMPKRRQVWSSWNYMGLTQGGDDPICLTYWMNRLQRLPDSQQLFVTLNPGRAPRAGTLLHSETYEHPLLDGDAMRAQRRLWSLQGQRRTWFCGAYFGAGFHEDGLQSALAVAEAVGDVRRPWTVADESSRISVEPVRQPERMREIAV